MIHQQQWVWSDRLQVKGVIDAVAETEQQWVPIEYKKGKMGNHLSDHFQHRHGQPDKPLKLHKLGNDAKKLFLQACDRKLNQEFKHPVFGYRCTYRRAIELQARLLSRYLQEGIPYKPLILR